MYQNDRSPYFILSFINNNLQTQIKKKHDGLQIPETK